LLIALNSLDNCQRNAVWLCTGRACITTVGEGRAASSCIRHSEDPPETGRLFRGSTRAGPLADCATDAARNTAVAAGPLRVGIIDSSYDSMPWILHEVQARYPRPAHPPG